MISSEPIQMRRTWSIETTSARAFSWAGVHTCLICSGAGRSFAALGAQLLHGLDQRHMFAQGAFDNRNQLSERNIVRNGGEAQRLFRPTSCRAGSTSRPNGPARPSAGRNRNSPGRSSICAGVGHGNKPVARFRMDVYFGQGLRLQGAAINAKDQMAVDGQAVVFLELRAGQIPMGVKPVRIAGSQK